MKAILLKSHKRSMVTKAVGLLGFIALCAACLANPFAAFAGNNPSSVTLTHDYGSINQLSVMPNGQLAMKLKLNSTLHGAKRTLASPSADTTAGVCATSDAQEANETPDAEDANKTPDANSTPSAQAAINRSKAQVASTTPNVPSATDTSSAQEANETPDAEDANKTPDADDACASGAAASNKVAVLSTQIPAGHILAVKFGTNQVVCISLPNGQCLMPDGKIMNLKR